MSDESSSQDDLDRRYWAERKEREAREARKRRRRERRWYSLGMTAMWAASAVFAFGLGYGKDHHVTSTTTLWAEGVVIGLLVVGLGLMSTNGRGRKLWIEDPEAADRWRADIEREGLMR